MYIIDTPCKRNCGCLNTTFLIVCKKKCDVNEFSPLCNSLTCPTREIVMFTTFLRCVYHLLVSKKNCYVATTFESSFTDIE